MDERTAAEGGCDPDRDLPDEQGSPDPELDAAARGGVSSSGGEGSGAAGQAPKRLK